MGGLAGCLVFPRANPAAVRLMAEQLAHRAPGPASEIGPLALSGAARRGEMCAAADGEHSAEALLDLFEKHGESMLPRLRGSFAFALWDGAALLLARDAFGEKPLVYCTQDSKLWFASEPRALKAGGAPLGGIDRAALSDYLELLYVPAPATFWAGVRKLPAGHLLRATSSGIELRRWHELPVPGTAPRRPSRVSVRARLEEAVRQRAGSSPAALLSGDLDSSAVVALLTRQLGRIRTFSVGFGEADEDLAFSRRIAERFRSEHHELILRPLSPAEGQKALSVCAEPLGDPALVPALAVFRALSDECKLVLTSNGGDELFAGHDRYRRIAALPHSQRVARAAQLLRKVAPRQDRGKLGRAALALGSRGAERARALIEVFSLEERRALLHGHARVYPAAATEAQGDVDAALAFDLGVWLPDGLLARTDAASTRFGVEARAALLDAALAELVVPPAPRHKLARVRGEKLLRDAVADLLPRDVLRQRRARAQGVPVGAWLRGPLRAVLGDLVRAPSARIRTFLDPRAVDRALDMSLAPRGNPSQAWALLALEIWAREQR